MIHGILEYFVGVIRLGILRLSPRFQRMPGPAVSLENKHLKVYAISYVNSAISGLSSVLWIRHKSSKMAEDWKVYSMLILGTWLGKSRTLR